MKLHTIAAVALAALVVSVGAAVAAPGNAPADAGGDDSTHGQSDDAPAGGPEDASTAGGDANAGDAHGPAVDLPGQVPDFVTEIHDAIDQFLNGTLDSLGDAVSGIAGANGGENAAHASG